MSLLAFIHERIVDVALLATTIEGIWVGIVQGCICGKPLRKVWVGQKQFPIRD
jgi:hypothetical protein